MHATHMPFSPDNYIIGIICKGQILNAIVTSNMLFVFLLLCHQMFLYILCLHPHSCLKFSVNTFSMTFMFNAQHLLYFISNLHH